MTHGGRRGPRLAPGFSGHRRLREGWAGTLRPGAYGAYVGRRGKKKRLFFFLQGDGGGVERAGGWKRPHCGKQQEQPGNPSLPFSLSESLFPRKAREFLLPIADRGENGPFQLLPRAPSRACWPVLLIA